MWIDIIGYVGMALVLCSFLMKKLTLVRLVNMCGAILSLVYGILTHTWPTAILNGSLLLINGIYLILDKTRKKKAI